MPSNYYYKDANYSVDRSLGFLVNTVANLLNGELETLVKKQLGVSLAQWPVATLLHENEAATAASLCFELSYDSGAMTRLIDQLEVLQLVIRKPHETDRRTYSLTLTAKGIQAAKKGFQLAMGNLNRAMADLTPREGDQLIALLQRVKGTTLAAKEMAR